LSQTGALDSSQKIMMLLSFGGNSMFHVRASEAEGDDANTLRLRHLQSIFVGNNRESYDHDQNDLMSNNTANFTSGHYDPPTAEGHGGLSTTYTDSSAPTNRTQAYNSIDSNSHVQTQSVTFTLIFLALMTIYVCLFCTQLRRESSSRAANGVNEQRKLEERKKRIGEVLLRILIVEDEGGEDNMKLDDLEKGEKDDGTRANTASDFNDSGEDEENQVMNDMVQGNSDDNDDEDMGIKEATEENTLAQDDDPASTTITMAKQQDETLSTSTIDTTMATASSSSSDRTIHTIPSNSNEIVPTIGASATPSTSMAAVPSTPPSSHFRKYADALSCNKCRNRNSDASSSSNNNNSNNSSSGSSPLSTITLSTIQQTYEEECIICFSNFQVGDLVAWSKDQIKGCTHMFHDECVTRWLLVQDCCPICRRSYLNEEVG